MGETARDFHRLTNHDPAWRRPRDPRLVHGFRPMRPDRQPPQFKTFPGCRATPLPRDLRLGATPDVGMVGSLLFLSAGVTRVKETLGERVFFRAAASAGNLAPVELYLVTGDIDGLDPGIYHYQPREHGLVRLTRAPSDAPTALVLTGVPWRTAWKYRERGLRHCYWDAGTMLANTLTASEAAGCDARVELAFADAELAALVGADGTHEFPLALLRLGAATALPEPADAPFGQLADNPLEFPLITETQHAGDLHEADVAAWARSSAELPTARAPAAGEWTPHGPIPELIRRRGATRRFDPALLVPLGLLTDALAWAARPVHADFLPAGGTLLEHNIAIHAVDGIAPGLYRWGTDGLNAIREGDVRDLARALCLAQDLGGDSSYTAFHCADVDRITAALGSRGYRAAQLEAGIAAGRLQLAAFDHRFGATGLTFFDDEVRRAFETEAWPMLVTAVGAPAYRSKPGGLPGQPARLSPT